MDEADGERNIAASGSTAPRWRRALPTIATIVAVVVFVSAGNWQRGRLADKEALAAQIAAAETAPPLAIARVGNELGGLRFRQVEASGRFLGDRQVLIDNRVHRGRVGYHVYAPLLLADGRSVLVNRGFAPAAPTRGAPPEVPAPPGEVTINGRLNLPPARYLELGMPPPGRVWQNLDLARFEREIGLRVLPFIVEQTDGPADALVRDWPRPDVSGDKHRIYMMQWYAFAALAAGLWAWFTLRRRR